MHCGGSHAGTFGRCNNNAVHLHACPACSSDGLAQQVLSSLAKLKGHKDGVLSLAATLVLLMLTSEDAHPAYMASVAAAVLLDQLLQVSGRNRLLGCGVARHAVPCALGCNRPATVGCACCCCWSRCCCCCCCSVAAAAVQSEHSFEEVSACCPAGTKLVRLLKARPLSGLLASTGVATQRELLLVALVRAPGASHAPAWLCSRRV